MVLAGTENVPKVFMTDNVTCWTQKLALGGAGPIYIARYGNYIYAAVYVGGNVVQVHRAPTTTQ